MSMEPNEPVLAKTALVVAHPDDEILWFSSVADKVAKVFIVYMQAPGQDNWSSGRAAAAEQYPLANTEFLRLTESMCFLGADWRNPQESDYGMRVSAREGLTLPQFDPQRYRDNYQTLVTLLRERLQGYDHVISHSPWGEYGHEEHVQLYRAVNTVQRELSYQQWFSNYCSDRSSMLMTRHLSGETRVHQQMPTNKALAKQVECLYRQHNCWTWPFDHYVPFDTENLILDQPGRASGPAQGGRMPLNFIDVDGGAPTAVKSGVSKLLRKKAMGLFGRREAG